MIPFIEPVLYIDLQAVKPKGFCIRCGGERYGEGDLCRACGEKP